MLQVTCAIIQMEDLQRRIISRLDENELKPLQKYTRYCPADKKILNKVRLLHVHPLGNFHFQEQGFSNRGKKSSLRVDSTEEKPASIMPLSTLVSMIQELCLYE